MPDFQPSLRTSLRASTLDGVFAAIFSNLTGGVLLSNFLVQLRVSTVAIGFVTAAPLLMNLLQPLGAYLSQCTHSRYRYGLWVFGCSRLLWLMLTVGIIGWSWPQAFWRQDTPQSLIWIAVAVILSAEILAALGSASWLSWMAALIPNRLRGRYFGFRNSVINLTVLVCVPLAGLGVAHWPGGSIQGYGVMLLLGVAAGLLSLWSQAWMRDIDPQGPVAAKPTIAALDTRFNSENIPTPPDLWATLWQQRSLTYFLLYWGLWTFGMNFSAPYFNLYLLSELRVDVSWVTGYNSLMAGATLLSLLFWGRLSDRLGNRPLMLLLGIVIALTPLLWLGIHATPPALHLWLPLLFGLAGCTIPAMELWGNNLQITLVQITLAPMLQQTSFFALVAAVGGVCGALGIFAGGCIAQFCHLDLPAIFALSSLMRLGALLPLLLVQEPGSISSRQLLGRLLGWQPQLPVQDILEQPATLAPVTATSLPPRPLPPRLCSPLLSKQP